MAEENTFTVDTTVPTETLTDNLTPDEQDSLAVGEKMVEEQEQLLAGKYKSAQDLSFDPSKPLSFTLAMRT